MRNSTSLPGSPGPSRDPLHSRDAPDTLRPQSPVDAPGQAAAPPDDAAHAGGIVVGIDGSEESRSALHWAIRQAQHTGAAVHAVAVWQQPLQFGASAEIPAPIEDFESEARSWVSDALPDLTPDERAAEVHAHTEQGDPAQQLLHQSARADLLVLGNHGRGAVSGALLGSVAQRCAHHARCPVVLVPTEVPAPNPTSSRTGRST